jgi:hypothetical protein
VSLTVIDSTTALEPDTLKLIPFTLIIASVVNVTSSYAALSQIGAISIIANINVKYIYFFIILL